MSVNFKLDYDSVAQVCQNADQLMVYGFSLCNYASLKDPLLDIDSPVNRVFDWHSGDPFRKVETLEGRTISLLKIPTSSTARICKNGVTNLILENYKRKKEEKPIIPCVFAADYDGKHPAAPLDEMHKRMTTKEYSNNCETRWKELRRIYKLCHDPKLPAKIRAVAQETFIFIKLAIKEKRDLADGAKEETLAFVKIDAPWEGTTGVDFNELWKQRLSLAKPAPKSPEVDWRKQLIAHSEAFDAQFIQQLIKTMQDLETTIGLALQKPKADIDDCLSINKQQIQLLRAFIAANVTSRRFRRRLDILEHQYKCLRSRDRI